MKSGEKSEKREEMLGRDEDWRRNGEVEEGRSEGGRGKGYERMSVILRA